MVVLESTWVNKDILIQLVLDGEPQEKYFVISNHEDDSKISIKLSKAESAIVQYKIRTWFHLLT